MRENGERPCESYLTLASESIKYTIINLSYKPAVFLEMKTRTYFGEDDVMMLENK